MAERWVDVSHEALIRGWPRLRRWIEEDRAGLLVHRRLSEAAQEWQRLNQDEGGLYRGARLTQALEWRERNEAALNDVETAFLNASVALRNRHLRDKWIRRAVVVAASILVIAAAILIVRLRMGAEAERRISLARQLEANSRVVTDDVGEVLVKVLLLVESLNQSWTKEAYAALVQRIVLLPRRPVAVLHTGAVSKLAVSFDNERLAVLSRDGRVGLWAAVNGRWEVVKESLLDEAPGNPMSAVAFSRNGQWLATGCGEDACVCETTTGRCVPLALKQHGGFMLSAAFSPDGRFVATAFYGFGGARLYETSNLYEPSNWKPYGIGISSDVFSIAFSPDSRRLAISGNTGDLTVWDTATREPFLFKSRGRYDDPTLGFPAGVPAFSPDGKWLVAASYGKVFGWKVSESDEAETEPLETHDNKVESITFSPNGSRMLTTSDSGIARLWEVSDSLGPSKWRELSRLLPGIAATAFSPDGLQVVTGSSDGIIGMWAVPDRWEAFRVPHGDSVAFSSNGRWLATANRDGSVKVFETAAWPALKTLLVRDQEQPTDQGVTKVAFTPDDRRLLTLSRNAVRVFETDTGRSLPPMKTDGSVLSVSVSPNGKWLAAKAETREGTRTTEQTWVWDLTTADSVSWVSREYEHTGGRGKYRGTGNDQARGDPALASQAAAWTKVSWEGTNQNPDSVARNAAGEVEQSGKITLEVVHEDGGTPGVLSPDSRWLATPVGGTTRIWPVEKERIIEEACKRLPRNLTEEEWHKYVGEGKPRKTCPDLQPPEPETEKK